MRKGVIILALALVVLSSLASANKAPLIKGLPDNILMCESSRLSVKFNALDLDGDALFVGISSDGPFYAHVLSRDFPITEIELFSDNLIKSDANKIYEQIVFVSDGQAIDSKKIKITVLETNNPPEIQHLSVSTVDLSQDKDFTKQVSVSDEESGSSPEDFSFTVSDSLNLLDLSIDNTGLIRYVPSDSHIGVHDIKVCAADHGVGSIDGKLGFCDGGVKAQSCANFQLAITEENSPPTILAYNSTNHSTRFVGTEKLYFQISKFDPEGLRPDTYWYVDDVLKEIDTGGSLDAFAYSFGCSVWGNHKVSAIITDGILDDSVEWPLDITKIPCPEGIIQKESIGPETCDELWGCSLWNLCQNAEQSLNLGVLDSASYKALKLRCNIRKWDTSSCGYQVRSCADINSCNSLEDKPVELQPCEFSINPSCSDGIENCHDKNCELLTDCGGPCSPCPTCSDNFKNQGEDGTDCGGPCSDCSVAQSPASNGIVTQSMFFIFLAFLILAFMQAFRILKTKKILEEQPPKRLVLKYG
jgi:hypothetical protein